MYKMKNFRLYGARTATIMLLVGVMFIFILPQISAFTFDDVITYSNDDLKVEFNDCDFWLLTCLNDGELLGSVELKSHKSVDEILKVGFGGEFVVMYYDFENWSLYENGLGEVYFEDMKTGKQIQKDYYFVEWKEVEFDVNDYEEVCDNTLKNGTGINCVNNIIGIHKEKRFEWVRYESNDIPARNIRIGLKTYVGKEDYIDGVWTIAGKEITKHITWAGDIQPIHYYNLDETSGAVLDSLLIDDGVNQGATPNVAGKINTAYAFDGVGYIDGINLSTTDISLSFWAYPMAGVTETMIQIGHYSNRGMLISKHSNGSIVVNAGTGSSKEAYFSTTLANATWNHIIVIVNTTGTTIYIDGVQDATNPSFKSADYTASDMIIGKYEGGQTYTGSLDEIAISDITNGFTEEMVTWLYNSGNGRAYGDFIYPTITPHYPTNNTNFTTTNQIIMNATIFDDGSITNATLYLNNVGNETNLTAGVNNSLYTFTRNMGEGDTYWLIEACDNASKCINSSARLFNVNTTPNIYLNVGVPINNFNSTTDSFDVNVTLTETYFKNITFDLYNRLGTINRTVTFTNTSRNKEWTNLIDGDYSYNVTTATTLNVFNNTATRNISIDANVPAVNVFYPTANIAFHQNNTNLYLNWSANDTHLSHCIYNYNTTNITATCSDNQTTINITDYANSNLTFWVSDTFGNVNTTFVSWEYRLFKVSESFTLSVTEGSSSIFSINLLTNGSDITLGNLSYNSQRNLGTITETSTDNFTITRNIIAPPVTTNTNYSFFWNISQGNFNYALTSQNQTVTDISIDNCTNNTIVLYNFTIVDEETQTKLSGANDNTTGKIDLSLYNIARTTAFTNYSTFFNETNPFYICVNKTFGTSEKFVIDVQVEYDADTYEKELYHIQNETLNSTTINMNKTLYDLLTTNSQVFKLIAKDSSFLALSNAIIEIKRKYVDEGTFKIIEIPLTDADGKTTAHLKVNDAIYTFIVKKFGSTILTVSNVIPVCQTPLITTCTIDFNAISSGITVPDYEEAEDFNYTLGYNSTLKVITTNFVIPSGEVATMVLTVTREDALGTAICSDTLTSNIGTLSCIVPNSFGNSTVRATLTKDGEFVSFGNIKLDQNPSDIYGTSLVFLGLFIMLTLIGASVSDNPIFTIISFMVGVILLFALNLVANNGFIGGTASILWLIVAIIILIIKGARRN